MSLFSNFPQGGKKAGVQSISDGGTGATTAEAALANLGGFPKADGEALKTRIQPINLGGTGASEANEARQNLGAAAVKEMTKAEYDALPAIDPTIFYALTDVEADGVKIEAGSYVGTGTHGSSNKNSLTFSFDPKVVIIIGRGSYGSQSIFVRNAPWSIGFRIDANIGSTAATEQGYSYTKTMSSLATWGSNKLSWYNTKNADAQDNSSGSTYYYVAIG